MIIGFMYYFLTVKLTVLKRIVLKLSGSGEITFIHIRFYPALLATI